MTSLQNSCLAIMAGMRSSAHATDAMQEGRTMEGCCIASNPFYNFMGAVQPTSRGRAMYLNYMVLSCLLFYVLLEICGLIWPAHLDIPHLGLAIPVVALVVFYGWGIWTARKDAYKDDLPKLRQTLENSQAVIDSANAGAAQALLTELHQVMTQLLTMEDDRLLSELHLARVA